MLFISRRFLTNLALLGMIVCLVGAMKLAGDDPHVAELVSAVLGDNMADSAEDEAAAPICMSGDPANNAVSLLVQLDSSADKQAVGQLLQILAQNNAKASFFVSGQLAEAQPELLQSILAGGHELGSLGYDDTSPASLNRWENQAALERANQAIAKASGVKVRLYLPLYGVTALELRQAAADCGLTFVLGGVDSGDWQPEAAPEDVIAAVLSGAESGSFISIGCGESLLAALDTILKEITAQGLAIITVTENLPQ